MLSDNSLGQAVLTHVPMSPSSITWYRPMKLMRRDISRIVLYTRPILMLVSRRVWCRDFNMSGSPTELSRRRNWLWVYFSRIREDNMQLHIIAGMDHAAHFRSHSILRAVFMGDHYCHKGLRIATLLVHIHVSQRTHA